MDFDPHILQQLVQKIHQQVRCPQCGKQIPVDVSSVRVASDDFILMQLLCDTCQAYIVLHATVNGVEHLGAQELEKQLLSNVSTMLCEGEEERDHLRDELEKAGGSFEKIFKQLESKKQLKRG
jgi:transcription elongation factor Elf1